MNKDSTISEMAASFAADKATNPHKQKLYKPTKGGYKEQSDRHKGQLLSRDLRAGRAALKDSAQRIDLFDTAAVENRTDEFLTACELAEVYPSVMNLALAYGYTRQGLNQWMLAHPGHATTDFINRTKDLFAQVLTNAALYDNANPVMALFQLKNHYQHADRIDIAPVTNAQSENDYNADEIRRRYLND